MKKKLVLGFLVVVALFTITGCESNKNAEKKEEKKGINYLVLVNKKSKLPRDWEENVQLVNTKNAWDEDIKVEKKAYQQYKKLKAELKKEGVEIELDSVYRSVKEQQELWDEWSKDPEKGIEYVKKYVAVPGYSEHHTGLAIDICLKKDGKLVYENDEMIADKESFSKIHEKLANYGFILRYLDGRDDITGYSYEPWHLRFINDKKVAKEIMDKDITFEEYLDSIKDIKSNSEAAKYQIIKTLDEHFKDVYGDDITNSRFDVYKIYSKDEEKNDELVKSLKIGDKDVAFEVDYEVLPKDGIDKNKIMVVDGRYDEELGWIVDLHRVGVLKYNKDNDSYSIKNFGTGF